MSHFPDPISAWTFLAILFAFLTAASVTDLRAALVPKWVSLPMTALGVVANLIRGAYMAAHGGPNWLVQTGSVWGGALDGLLFSLSGLFVAFLVLFLLWLFGACGGGDVKLFAALGAWVGPMLVMWVLAGSLVILSLIVLAAPIVRARKPAAPGNSKKPLLVRYSAVVLLAAIPVLLWGFRADLQLGVDPGLSWLEGSAGVGSLGMLAAPLPRGVKRRRRGRRGSISLEFLFILPILLLLLFGMIQFSFLLSASQRLEFASREGARVAATCGTRQDIEQAVRDSLGPGRLSAATIEIIPPPPDDFSPVPAVTGDPVELRVTIPFNTAVPNLLSFIGFNYDSHEVEGRTVMRKE